MWYEWIILNDHTCNIINLQSLFKDNATQKVATMVSFHWLQLYLYWLECIYVHKNLEQKLLQREISNIFTSQ